MKDEKSGKRWELYTQLNPIRPSKISKYSKNVKLGKNVNDIFSFKDHIQRSCQLFGYWNTDCPVKCTASIYFFKVNNGEPTGYGRSVQS